MMTRAFNLLFLPLLGWLLIGCASLESGAGVSPASSANGKKGPVFDITAYGAVDHPTVSSTDAFRLAIADCQKAGGGIVRVPAGHFLTGPIDMVDNMTLQVDKGAVVLFETDRTKCPDITSRWKVSPKRVRIRSFSPTASTTSPSPAPAPSTDKALPGGQRWTWPSTATPVRTVPSAAADDGSNQRLQRRPHRRPQLPQFPFWAIHLLYSENIDVGNCRIINPPDSPTPMP